MEGLYVQFGCGQMTPERWINFDASPTVRIQRIPGLGFLIRALGSPFPKNVLYGDICIGLPVGNNSSAGVYCSHVLEHLALEDCKRALVNTYKILSPGGRFRLVMPDLQIFVARYVASNDAGAAYQFMAEIGQQKRPRGIRAFLHEWLGNSAHRWLWDYAAIEHELQQVGFTGIRRAVYGDSVDPIFNLVEEKERWDDCLGVECQKPPI